MKKLLSLIMVFLFFISAEHVYATQNPFLRPNNRIGIHILFPSELQDAAKLVNASGGDWGYVTIPIQAGDRDLIKWQTFMDDCRRLHIIPIIRLATEGDYFNTTSWRKPNENDIVDFANFLNSLVWPTRNRYVIVFNEVNRGDEWGGTPNAAEYANLLSFSTKVFKSRNQDFFIISAGLDNAAPNSPGVFENEYDFMRDMYAAVPQVFTQIDGMGSHSYPNPGFSQPPTADTPMSAQSFMFERSLIANFSGKTLPVFITETGWSTDALPDTTVSMYYSDALTGIWQDPDIVAITPFLLTAGAGPFEQFTFFKPDGSESMQYKVMASLPKTKGQPEMAENIRAVLAASATHRASLPTVNFVKDQTSTKKYHLTDIMTDTLKWIFKI